MTAQHLLTSSLRFTLHRALATLSSHCDGAAQRDGEGFSKADASLGNYLAAQPSEQWTETETTVALELTRTYRRQLTDYGIDTDALPVPTPEQVQSVRDAARIESAKRRGDSGLCLIGTTLVLRAGYDADRTADTRGIPTRRWDPDTRRETFSVTAHREVLELCETHGVPVLLTPAERASLPELAAGVAEAERQQAAQREAAARAAAEVAARTPQVTLQGCRVEFRFPYDPPTAAVLKAAGARWDGDSRCWHLPAGDLPGALAAARKAGLRVDVALTVRAEEAAAAADQAAEQAAAARTEALAARDDLTPLCIPGITTPLMPHQSAPVRMLEITRRLLIADAPGLGKTLTSVAALLHLGARRSVVVCPNSLTGNWVREFQQHTDGTRRVWIMEGTRSAPVPADVDVVVLGWSVLSDRAADLRAWKPDALVVDEAHYGKSGKGSARAEAAMALSGTVRGQGGMVLLLTGTPVVNRPVELLPLLRMLGAEGQFGGAGAFLERYCGPRWQTVRYGETKKVYDGASNTQELNERLNSSGVYIRRTKADLVRSGQMGNKIINGVSALDLSTGRAPEGVTLDAAGQVAYDRAVSDFQTFIADVITRRAAAEGVTLTPSEFGRRIRASTETILPQIGYVRQVLGLAKVSQVVARAQALVDQGEQVVIVAHHREVVEQLCGPLGAVRIQGGMTVRAVEEAKRAFNHREVMVMVLAMEAGKTGHTLCLQRLQGAGPECAHMLIAEESWAPGDEEQAQDRLWRIGQTRDVQVVNLTAKGTMDEGVFRLREQKRGVVAAVTDGTALDEDRLQVTSFLTGYLMGDRAE